MRPIAARLVGVAASAGLVFGGCSTTSSSSSGGSAAADAGMIVRGAGMDSAQGAATGFSSGTMSVAVARVVAKRVATAEQKRVALERARRAAAKIERRAAARATAPTASGAPKKTPAHTRKPRYIAVDTVQDARTSPKADRTVMIFDTEAQQIVGNDVYDVQSPPPVGSTARFETYAAEYVGAGL